MQRAIEIYERRTKLALYLGAGVGGLVLIGAGSLGAGLFASAPRLAAPIFITLVLATAVMIGFAYSGYEYKAECMKREIADGKLHALHKANGFRRWTVPEFLYLGGLLLMSLAGLWLAAVYWLVAVAPGLGDP